MTKDQVLKNYIEHFFKVQTYLPQHYTSVNDYFILFPSTSDIYVNDTFKKHFEDRFPDIEENKLKEYIRKYFQ